MKIFTFGFDLGGPAQGQRSEPAVTPWIGFDDCAQFEAMRQAREVVPLVVTFDNSKRETDR